ncbi:MAG: ABC transporter substrate-binding protein [Coriobacteriales bacterium]|nr:ABC transporter substrate-binding protein [Coriobacteriales bacterium]
MSSYRDLVCSRRGILCAGATLASLGLASCANSGSGDVEGAPGSAPEASQLTVDPGHLTIATGNPAFEPWVIGDDQESGEGFEAALGYALAERLGFARDSVTWVRTSFEEAYAPGVHDWDINLQQVSITDERASSVDFSPSYLRPTQSVVVRADSELARAQALSELAGASFAVAEGSTAYDYVQTLVAGSEKNIRTHADNADAAQAVSGGQADAIVTDTPDAYVMASYGQIENGIALGQIPGSEDKYGLGATLAKGSMLTPLVAKAMDSLVDDGTIDKLANKWLAGYIDVPKLRL